MMFRPCLLLLCVVVVTWALDCKPLGMEDRTIPDVSLSASSEINKWYGAREGRLYNFKSSTGVGAWCANKKDNVVNRYIQIDLGAVRKICKIATQGRNTKYESYVKNYRIVKSKQGIIFTGIFDKVTLEETVFTGNTDKNSIVLNDLPSIEARYIRVIPMEFKGQICMRIELCECEAPVTTPAPVTNAPVTTQAPTPAPTQPPVDIDECSRSTDKCNKVSTNCRNFQGGYECVCKKGYKYIQGDNFNCELDCASFVPVGISDGRIANSSFQASSHYSNYPPWKARLNNRREQAWYGRPSDRNPWIQVDLGSPTPVEAVATRGKRFSFYVTTYKLGFSDDGKSWTMYKESGNDKVFQGNADYYQVVTREFSIVKARFFRIYPQTWNHGIALRFELYTCKRFT